jgi:hypothetical protein
MASKTHNRGIGHVQQALSPADVEVVQAQLARMLNDPLFNQSRRYPRLFRYIVEASLAGQFDTRRAPVPSATFEGDNVAWGSLTGS